MSQQPNLRAFRARFHFSQADLALLLGISRGQLAMAETGKRSLPQPAFDIFKKLHDVANEPVASAESIALSRSEEIQQREEGLREQWRSRLKIIGIDKAILQLKLEKVSASHQEVSTALHSITGIMASLDNHSSSFLELKKSLIEKRLRKYDAAAQTRYKVQIEVLEAEEVILKRWLSNPAHLSPDE